MEDKIVLTLRDALAKRLVGQLREDGSPAMTEWSNPTQEAIRLEVFLGPITPHHIREQIVEGERVVEKVRTVHLATFVGVEIEPGKKAKLPSEWDRVVHRVHNGSVIGGQAPLLRRTGQGYEVDKALLPPSAGGPLPLGPTQRRIES